MQPLLRSLKRLPNPLIALVAADFVVGFASLVLAAWLRFGFDLALADQNLGSVAPRAGSFAVWLMAGLVTMGMYRSRQRPTAFETIARVLVSVCIGGVADILCFYLLPSLSTGRGVLGLAMGIAFVLLSATRLGLLHVLDRNPAKRRVVVVGSGRVAARVGMLRRRADRRRFDVVAYVPGSVAERELAERLGLQPLAADAGFESLRFDEIVIALDDRRGAFPTATLLRQRYHGIPVVDIVEFLEQETGKIDLDVLRPGWIIFNASGHTALLFRAFKRVLDLATSSIMLVLVTPLLAVAIAGIWLEDGPRAPLLYRQRRVGRNGHVFELLKFRSMRPDAEHQSGPRWSVKGDDRVTRTGRIMRRFRIDELPQLVNILRGEMSIVGPRPERPEFVDRIGRSSGFYDFRHSVRPGLTGWAQLNFPYGASVEDAIEKLKYDLFYIKNARVIFDLFILMQTLEVVIWGKATSMAGPRETVEGGAPEADPAAQLQLFPRRRDVA